MMTKTDMIMAVFYSFSCHGFEYFDSMMCAVNVKWDAETFKVTT